MPTGQGLQEVHTNFTFRFDGSKLGMVERGVKRSVTGLNTIAQQTDIFQQRMGNFFARAKQVIGVYLGFRAVRSITSDYATAADTVAKFATATGISTEQYQGLVHAVKLGGSDAENLNKALTQLSKRALEAGQGLKTNQRAFNELGVSWKNANGELKSADQLFMEISDAFVGMTDESKRTGLSMQLLGRTGAKLLPTMLTGSKGIQKMITEAKKLGIVLSKDQLKAAENYNDEMLRVKSVLTGVRNTIAGKLLPAITAQLKAFQEWYRRGRNAERVMRALKITAIFTAAVIARLIGAKVIKGITMFVQGIIAGVRALRAMNVQLLIASIKTLLIVAGVLLLIGLIEDFVGFLQGKDSVIGRLLGDTGQAAAIKEAILSIGREIKKTWAEIAPALLAAWNDVKPALAEMGKALKPIAGVAFRVALALVVAGFHGIAAAVKLSSGAIRIMSKVISALGVYLKHLIKGFQPVINMLNKIIGAANRAGYAISLITGNVELQSEIKKQWQSKGGRSAESFGKVGTPGFGGDRSTSREAFDRFVAAGGQVPSNLPPSYYGGSTRGGNTNTTTANVAPGAITVNVRASGDPAQIANQVDTQVKRSIWSVFTDASRDLVKAPSGQR